MREEDEKNIECDTIDSKINFPRESGTIAWSAIVQGAIFFHYLAKEAQKRGEAWKKHIIMYNGRKQRMEKIKCNLREIIFQSDAKNTHMKYTDRVQRSRLTLVNI